MLIEKPLALLPQDAYRILDLCREAGVGLFVNHQLRYFSPFAQLKERLAQHSIGRLRAVRATTRAGILEHGTHLFDLVSAITGDHLRLSRMAALAHGADHDGPTTGAPTYVHGVAVCEDDTRVYFECGPAAPRWPGTDEPWHQFGIDLLGEHGRAGLSLNKGWWYHDGRINTGANHDHGEQDDAAQHRLMADLLACMDAPDRHPCGPAGTRISLNAVVAVHRAALHQTWMAVAEPGTNAEFEKLTDRLNAQSA
jgi:predicted dehydrogenase